MDVDLINGFNIAIEREISFQGVVLHYVLFLSIGNKMYFHDLIAVISLCTSEGL
jgi:hypothetical protein